MDLWIRSQDRKRLTKVEDLYLVHDDKQFCDYLGNNMVGHLAKYTKKGRALEVLDEIQEFIENKDKIKITQDVNGITSEVEDAKRVYVMPEE